MSDPFDALRHDPGPQQPRPSFVRSLRRRLLSELELDDTSSSPDDIPNIDLPERKARAMSTPSSDQTATTDIAGLADDEAVAAADQPGSGGGIWASVSYRDALAGIRFLVDVLGFDEQLVVTGPDERTVVHSQLRWPEGGIVSPGTYDPDNIYNPVPGEQSLYVVTADPQAVWERCRAAGVAVVQEPYAPDHDPDGMGFGVRDPEGNIWSFGTYGGAT